MKLRFYRALRFIVLGVIGWVVIALYLTLIAAASALAGGLFVTIALGSIGLFAGYGIYRSLWRFWYWVTEHEQAAAEAERRDD